MIETESTETKKVPRRDEVPAEYTWDLSTVYASDTAWDEDVARLEATLPQIDTVAGTLSDGASALLRALTLRDEIEMALDRIFVYAMQRRDSDSSDPAGQALRVRASALHTRVAAALAFVEPEILAIPAETLAAWPREQPELKRYAFYLQTLERQRAHVRSAEVEAVVAQYGEVARAPRDAFDLLTNADLVFPTITDETGQEVQLSQARYMRYLKSPDRRVRRDTFKGLYGAYQGIRNTLGTTLPATVRAHVLAARVHDYASSLAASLEPNMIPLEVYHNLVATVNENLPRLHRYMSLRKRLMGLDELRLYDLYASLAPEADVAVSYAEATGTVREALAPLGPSCADVLDQALSKRWIDVYENVGKRSGAYSGGAYGTSPFILLNYQDRLDDAFTLAHELGHSLHSYFTRQTQPYIYGNYTLFVAEVASTLNESLLVEHLLKTRDDPALRRLLVVQQLEDIRATIFRQTMFAEFELGMHQQAEADEPLTADALSTRYYDLVGRYHGPEVVLDDEIALEWGRIPHFYRPFYVYQYATGLSAALTLSAGILSEGQPAVERYLRFLSSGGSRPSMDLLRDAGVDMTSPAPVQHAMDTFDRLLDQLEELS